MNSERKMKLTVAPYGGLANRMRAIASMVTVARWRESGLRVLWVKQRGCAARFDELFMPVNVPGVRVRDIYKYYFLGWPVADAKMRVTGLPRRLFYRAQFNDFDHDVRGGLKGLLPPSGCVFVSTCYSVAKSYPLSEIFVPVPQVQALIDEVKVRFSSKVIGVHIRRTDHRVAMQRNEVADFIGRMEREIAADPDVRFYLATDSGEVKRQLKETFGERIITYDAALTRGSVQGMRDAVVEFWCLSSTDRIIGSFTSSYSELAAEMGGIELEIL